MKFYLTKKAQLEAQGRSHAPAVSRAPRKSRSSTQEAPSIPVLQSAPLVEVPTPQQGPQRVPTKTPKAVKGVAEIGGVPRVDLLPLEVRAERRASVNVRRAWLGVVGVAVLAGIATGAATLSSMRAQDDLALSQADTASLSAEQAKFSKVKVVENQTNQIEAAQQVGGGTDIDWNSYLTKFQATLPAGTTIKSVAVDSASAVTPYTQSAAALQGVRIGTVTVTVESSTLPSVPKLLTSLTSLPGYVDATPGTVTATDNVYTANIVMHINEGAYSGRYTTKGK